MDKQLLNVHVIMEPACKIAFLNLKKKRLAISVTFIHWFGDLDDTAVVIAV